PIARRGAASDVERKPLHPAMDHPAVAVAAADRGRRDHDRLVVVANATADRVLARRRLPPPGPAALLGDVDASPGDRAAVDLAQPDRARAARMATAADRSPIGDPL